MPDEALDASNGNAPEGGATDAPPEKAERIRARTGNDQAETQEAAMEAMLIACGDLGYLQVTVRHVLERYGGHRLQFDRLFANKAECYEAAYKWEIDRLSATLLAAAASAGEWRAGLRAALAELARFIRTRPLTAKGLLIEVHVAGGRALAEREHAMEHLSRAIDSARRESPSHPSPPPITAAFMVSAIDASVVAALAKGDPRSFETVIPELAHMVVSAYFGEKAGREELDLASLG